MAKLTKDQKREEVARLAKEFQSAKAAIFTLFRGLSVREITALRKKLREQGISFQVVKTSLVKRALEQEKLPLPSDEILSQPIAVVFSAVDEITPTKLLSESSEKISLLGGLIEKKLVAADHLNLLATLPSREELLARLTATLDRLPRRLVATLQQPTIALTSVLRHHGAKEAQ